MDDQVIYRERLPKYVFDGSRDDRSSIARVQLLDRLLAASIFIAAVYLMLAPKTEHDAPFVWIGIAVLWVAIASLLYSSEITYKAELDGSTMVVVTNDSISIPPRFVRKLMGKTDSIARAEVDHIAVSRGQAVQRIAYYDDFRWKDAPIGLRIVTRSGKRISLGRKPPSTVKDIIEVLSSNWSIRIEDGGSGMGRGSRYVNGMAVGDYSYDELMKMNLFEYQA